MALLSRCATERTNLQYMTNTRDEQRKTLLTAWKEARANGQSQHDFCSTNGISSRILRTWVAAEGAPGTSARQVEIMLRRVGKHLLDAAEELATGIPDGPAAY